MRVAQLAERPGGWHPWLVTMAGTTPTTRGAVNREWYARWLAERGPWAFHVTDRSNREAIVRDGLVPWDERGGGRPFSVAATPRPGCVYFVTDRHGCDHQWELSSLEPASGLVVCLDLRRVEPERILPDEDPWSLGVVSWDEARWGLDPRATEQIGDGRRWRTGGEWAEAVKLGAQPGVVEWALSDWGRFAVVGTVSPDVLAIVEPDPDGRWSPPPA